MEQDMRRWLEVAKANFKFSLNNASVEKLVEKVCKSLARALNEPDVLVRMTFPSEAQFEIAAMTMLTLIQEVESLAATCDPDKMENGPEFSYEFRNGSCLQFIPGWVNDLN